MLMDEKEFYKKLGQSLKNRRLELGISVELLSHHLGIDILSIEKIENEEIAITTDQFIVFAKFLKLNYDDIL